VVFYRKEVKEKSLIRYTLGSDLALGAETSRHGVLGSQEESVGEKASQEDRLLIRGTFKIVDQRFVGVHYIFNGWERISRKESAGIEIRIRERLRRPYRKKGNVVARIVHPTKKAGEVFSREETNEENTT